MIQDNLPHTQLFKVALDPQSYPDCLLFVDSHSSHAWLVKGSHTRLQAQMHRQNYYYLDFVKNKGVSFQGLTPQSSYGNRDVGESDDLGLLLK